MPTILFHFCIGEYFMKTFFYNSKITVIETVRGLVNVWTRSYYPGHPGHEVRMLPTSLRVQINRICSFYMIF